LFRAAACSRVNAAWRHQRAGLGPIQFSEAKRGVSGAARCSRRSHQWRSSCSHDQLRNPSVPDFAIRCFDAVIDDGGCGSGAPLRHNIFYPAPDPDLVDPDRGDHRRAAGLGIHGHRQPSCCSPDLDVRMATYVLVERLTGSPRAAFVAGLMFACSAFRFDHYSHLELQMTQWMPLGLLALHLLVATGRWRYAAALAVTGAAQLYSSMYYAVFFLVYAAVIGGLPCFSDRRVAAVVPSLATLVAGLVACLARLHGTTDEGDGRQGGPCYGAVPADYLAHPQRHARTPLPSAPERGLQARRR
jgi:hypothetical protein